MLTACVEADAGALALDARIQARDGATLALVGANGAGKTTLLRCLAGLHRPRRGRVECGEKTWLDTEAGVDLPPHRRSVSLVPQEGLLFDHLDVAGNLAFGPRAAGLARNDVAERVAGTAARLGLDDLLGRRPATLSGGERQRVALARAVAAAPQALLLDEPLAALDPAARAEVRTVLRPLLAEWPGPTVLVTHDARDAVELAVDVVVLEHGSVVQAGSVAEVVRSPRTAAVAALVGVSLIRGTVLGRSGDLVTVDCGGWSVVAVADPDDPPRHDRAQVVIDPRAVTLHATHPAGSAQNVLAGRVASVGELGGVARVAVEGEVSLLAEVTVTSVATLGLRPGAPVFAAFKATAARAVA